MNPVIGRETYIEVGETKYRLSRCDRAIMAQMVEWASQRIGHPLDRIKDKLKEYPAKIQELMVKDALDRASIRHSLASPEIQAEFHTIEGSLKILSLLLRKYHPEITQAQVETIYDTLGDGPIAMKILEASGRTPEDLSDKEREALEAMGLIVPAKKKT